MALAAPLRHRGFRDLWLGQAISQLGDAFYYVVFMFSVKHFTGRDDMVGFVGAVEAAPFLLLGPYAGAIVDRIDRRKIMLWSDYVCAIVLAVLGFMTLSGARPPIWALFVVPCVLSIARVFFFPARSAAIPRLVPEADVPAANGLSMTTQSFAPLVGIALSAGLLSVLWDATEGRFFAIAVLANALSFLASAIFIRRIPAIRPERKTEIGHPAAEIVEGFQLIRRRADLFTIVALAGLVSLLISPFYPVYIATNGLWFDGKPATLAWFEFSFFLGMVSASLFVSARSFKRPGLAYVFGAATVGITVALMGVFNDLWMYILWNVLAGLALPFAQIPIQNYMQLTVEDQFRGRVNSAHTMVAMGAMPVGLSLAGVLIERAGLANAYFIMGFGMCAAALLGLASPAFRTAQMPEPSEGVKADGELVGDPCPG